MPSGGCRQMLTIGLINNMPDAALRATERHFEELLRAAAGGRAVRLKLFSIPQVPRGEAGRAHVLQYYQDVEHLWGEWLDGLIVTGAEPRARVLEDEPYWPVLADTVSWAEQNTSSTIWSCLAAQAAALRCFGIARRPLARKLSGVFECEKAANHPLLAALPTRWKCPHTRYHDLLEADLTANGCDILSRLPGYGVDMFASDRGSLFLFLQGHPEYSPDSLLREYRRDITRFLLDERETYPDAMHGYFAAETALALEGFRAHVLQDRDPALLQALARILDGWTPPQTWQASAVRLYAGWLGVIADRQSSVRKVPATEAALS